MFFEKLADFIMKRAKIIIAVWIIALIVAVPFAIQANSVMEYDLNKMSSGDMESKKGMAILNSVQFNKSGTSLGGGTIILVEAYDSQAAAVADKIADRMNSNLYSWKLNQDLREKQPDCQITLRLVGVFDDKYFKDRDTDVVFFSIDTPNNLPAGMKINAQANIPDIRDMLAKSVQGLDGVVKTYVTGNDAITYDTMTSSTSDIKHIDPISILLVLILIGLFFKSLVSAGTPPVVIGMAYGILLALTFGIGQMIGLFYITTILVLVTMLGAGCDYCIFIISRYREERKSGKDHREAVRQSIIWAGESILTSGLSVMIGFGSLMICKFSAVSTMGMILALGTLLALMAALTFVPSLLLLIGDRIFWPAKMESYTEGSKSMNGWYGKVARFGQRYFANSAKQSIKHAKVIVAATILLTIPLGYVALTSDSSYDMISTMPNGEAKTGVSVISEDLGGGLIMPTNIAMKVDSFANINKNSTVESGSAATGDYIVFNATPYTGYTVDRWERNGVSVQTGGNSYSAIASGPEMDVKVIYKKLQYQVSFSPSGEGTVTLSVNGSPASTGTMADYGSTLVFEAHPNQGYRVDYWEILDPSSHYTFTHDEKLTMDRLSHSYTVIPHFGPIPSGSVNVTYGCDGGGTVTARTDGSLFDSGVSIKERSHLEFTAIPDKDHQLKKWEIKYSDGTTDESFASNIEFRPDAAKIPTDVKALFEKKETHTYTVTFSGSVGGKVTATAAGKEIASGTEVPEGTSVVISATPDFGKVVHKWQYIYTYFTFDSYLSKKEYRISGITSDQNVNVVFGDPIEEILTLTYASADTHGSVVASADGMPVGTGADFMSGSDLYFYATPKAGYRVDHWTVAEDGGYPENYNAGETLSLANTHTDLDVKVYFTPVNETVIKYSVNDDRMGSVYARCTETYQAYDELPGATNMYRAFSALADEILNTVTDGKNNIALVIGPMNGDLLFDGEHEAVFSTIYSILPQEIKALLPATAYDFAAAAWNLLDYDSKQTINYWLTYRLGFVSDAFGDEHGLDFQYVKFMVVTKDEPMSALSVETVKQLYSINDDFMKRYNAENGGFVHETYLAGTAVANYEVSQLVSHDFGFIIMIVIVMLILLLFVVMRSYITPVRAVLTIVMSVLWTLGLTHLLFGNILGMQVVWIVPIVLFVVCLGLGMDYDILLTTRIKENVMKGMSNDDAIVAAIKSSGAVITLCGLIMAGAFSTMMLSTSPMLMEFGFALGFAIAVDALVIRTYVVPAIMHLLGNWNWRGPNLVKIKWSFAKIYEPTLGAAVRKVKEQKNKE